jgi:arylsulfatase A-like enzyme
MGRWASLGAVHRSDARWLFSAIDAFTSAARPANLPRMLVVHAGSRRRPGQRERARILVRRKGRARRRGTIVAVALTATVLTFAGPAHAASPSLPNVVFIHTDDHGWADVGFRGSIIDTPNIDDLAAAGVILDRYHTYPICGPTRVGLMTGRNPIRLGLTGNINDGEDGVALDEHFLPETFRAAGYQTWALGKWHLGGTTGSEYLPQSRGFDHFYGFLGGSINESTHEAPGTGVLDWQRNGTDVPEDDGQLSTDLLATEAISLIDGRDPSRPFLLYLAFHALHTPYDAPQTLVDKYAALGLTGDQLDYAAMAENMDINIGRVLDELTSEGIADDTLVVFASDNGAQETGGGSNLPLRGWKNEVFEGGHRTPAALRWPGVLTAGTTSTQFVSHLDWLPTLATAVGIATRNSKPLDGRDRWDAIRNGEAGRPHGHVIRRGQGVLVLDGDWKLLRETNAGAFQLYDVYADPNETTDLAGANPGVVASLAAYIALIDEDADGDFVADDEDPCTVLAGIAPPAEPVEQDPESLGLTLTRLDQDAGRQGLVAKGWFNPAGTVPGVDPIANGVRVRVEGEDGEIYDVSIPGGPIGTSPCDARDGWKVAVTSTRTRWTYVNKSNGLPDGLGGCTADGAKGVTTVLVQDHTAVARAAYYFKVVARNATFASIPAVPLTRVQVDFVLAADGGSASATAGQCAEFRLEGDPVPTRGARPYCRVSPPLGAPKTIACRGA